MVEQPGNVSRCPLKAGEWVGTGPQGFFFYLVIHHLLHMKRVMLKAPHTETVVLYVYQESNGTC